MIVQRVSGTHLGDILARDVFDPLGMRATAMIGRSASTPASFATGYRLVDGKRQRAGKVSRSLNSTGDGSLISTARDVALWNIALDEQQRLGQIQRMWSPVRLNNGTTRQYGFGWGLDSYRGHRIVEHGGSWQGFGAHVVRYVDDGVSVVVLTNLTGVGNTSGLIAHRIARYFIPNLRQNEWPAAARIRIDPARLERYSGYRWATPVPHHKGRRRFDPVGH